MNTLSKILGAMVLFGGGAYGISKLVNAGKTVNTGKKIAVSLLSVNPPKIKDGALRLSVNIALDNPTPHTLSLKKPYITVYSNGKPVGNSIASEEVVQIVKNDRTKITGLNVQIPFINLGAFLVSLLTGNIPKMAFDIEVKVVADGIPYTDKKHFEV